MRKPYSYIYPGELSSQIFKRMSNNIKTELDFNTEKDDPEDTRHLMGMVLSGLLIGCICVLAVILILLNGELIDKIKPQYQLVIFAVACAAFGTLRFVIWIRQKI